MTLQVEVTLSSESHFYLGVTENVSEGGICVISDQLIPIGTRVEVVMQLPTVPEPLACSADVRWHRTLDTQGRIQHGLRFLDMPPELADAMREFSEHRPPIVHSGN